MCRIQLVLGGARTVGLLASTSARSPTVLALVLILVLALDSVHVHLALVLALTLGKLAVRTGTWHLSLH